MLRRRFLFVIALCSTQPALAANDSANPSSDLHRQEQSESAEELPEGTSQIEQTPLRTRPDFILGHWAAEIPMVALVFAVEVGSGIQPQLSFSGHAPDNGFHGYHRGADLASDFTGDVGGAIIGLTLGSAMEWLHLRKASFLYSTMIAAEAWLLGSGTTRLIKHNVGRCRPIAWDEDTNSCDPQLADPITQRTAEEQYGRDESFQAMPSGHVSGISAISGSYFWLALQSKEPSFLRWTSFAATQAMAWTTMGLRVRAGAHSFTDTLVSWGMNTFIGMSVAAMHSRKTEQGGGASEDFSIRMVPMGQGVGVVGTF